MGQVKRENGENVEEVNQRNEVESRTVEEQAEQQTENKDTVNSFFDMRIHKLKRVKKEGNKIIRKTMSAIVSRKAITEENIDNHMKQHVKVEDNLLNLAKERSVNLREKQERRNYRL